MKPDEMERVAAVLDRDVVSSTTLAGGFSHQTCLLTLDDGSGVVARFGGPDPAVEAAVMAAAGHQVPVPEVLQVLPAADGLRPAMVLELVAGTPLSQILAESGDTAGGSLAELGAEVGGVVARISAVSFERPGFFTDATLTVPAIPPWSQQLPDFASACMADAPAARLDERTRRLWVELCAAHAPALRRIDDQARLVHADINPKNILVTPIGSRWRVDAVLDWEFSHAGCPYADAANMVRFGADYPDDFLAGFRAGFAEQLPPEVSWSEDWAYLGRVLDMFALSDLTTRPLGNPIADRAAAVIGEQTASGAGGGRAGRLESQSR